MVQTFVRRRRGQAHLPSGSGAQKRVTKHVSFDPRRNKVRLVRVPPRSQNRQYWFTETQRVVKKGLIFEVEPGVSTEVAIDVRLQITALSMPPELGHGASEAQKSTRSFLEVREMSPLFTAPTSAEKWLTVGSAQSGGTQRTRVVLPAGMYQLRVQGKSSLLAFAQAWDVERELS